VSFAASLRQLSQKLRRGWSMRMSIATFSIFYYQTSLNQRFSNSAHFSFELLVPLSDVEPLLFMLRVALDPFFDIGRVNLLAVMLSSDFLTLILEISLEVSDFDKYFDGVTNLEATVSSPLNVVPAGEDRRIGERHTSRLLMGSQSSRLALQCLHLAQTLFVHQSSKEN